MKTYKRLKDLYREYPIVEEIVTQLSGKVVPRIPKAPTILSTNQKPDGYPILAVQTWSVRGRHPAVTCCFMPHGNPNIPSPDDERAEVVFTKLAVDSYPRIFRGTGRVFVERYFIILENGRPKITSIDYAAYEKKEMLAFANGNLLSKDLTTYDF